MELLIGILIIAAIILLAFFISSIERKTARKKFNTNFKKFNDGN
tara:strand:- start:388 stop:519 length:132 start_codon:yes stop_codon:yes gene_type:complete